MVSLGYSPAVARVDVELRWINKPINSLETGEDTSKQSVLRLCFYSKFPVIVSNRPIYESSSIAANSISYQILSIV
jgi:hypothetical protein